MQALLYSMSLTPWLVNVDPRLCLRLLDTHRQVWLSLLWGHCSFLLGPSAHKVLFVLSKRLFPQSCVSSVIKSHWPLKSNSLGVLTPFARSSGWQIWALELLQQCENFFGIIVLQFVGHLLSGSIVKLMVPSSKRTPATCHTSQVCCSQISCPHGRSLLTCASAEDTQTLKCKDPSLLWDPWILVHKRSCLSPPGISGSYGV